MVTKKLGRGLDALIQSAEVADGGEALNVRSIDPKLIAVNRAQPRERFDEDSLAELTQSIKNDGLLQPLVVRQHENGGFELVAGERRLRAAVALNLQTVAVIVRDLPAEELLELALIENIQREDLNPMELARAYRDLRDQRGWTQAELASQLGKKRSSIANTLRLLDLPDPVQEGLTAGEISAGHAKALLSLSDSEAQLTAFRKVLEDRLTVRQLEKLLANPPITSAPESSPAPTTTASPGPAVRVKAPHVADQENVLSTALGTKVEIREGRGRGKIIIEFYSTDDFERIKRQILGR